MTDEKTDSLADEPFSYRETKAGQVFLYYLGRHVETLTDNRAGIFLSRIHSADAGQAQLLMAKATKNFKRGNEKTATRRRRR